MRRCLPWRGGGGSTGMVGGGIEGEVAVWGVSRGMEEEVRIEQKIGK